MTRTFPITGFVGPNGGGKTLCMVETLARPAMERGEPILANFRLRYHNWVPATSWGDVLSFTRGVVLIDEASAWVPSRESSKMPAGVLSHLNQLRKARVVVGWSGPAWGRCDKGLREVTLAAVWCKGFMQDDFVRTDEGRHKFPFSGRRAYDGSGRVVRVDGWPNRRLMHWSWFDPLELPEDLSGHDLDSPPKGVRAKQTRWYWRPGGIAQGLYDSAEAVLALDHLDDSGACVNCGGNRQRRKCSCAAANERVLGVS